MPFTVTVARSASIKQGLLSPVRGAAGLRPLEMPDGPGRPLELRIGIEFDDPDLMDSGWFLDTDTVAQHLDLEARRLESAPWTEIFSFRPTMELVSRHLFQRLQVHVERLAYVELSDIELGIVTGYAPTAG